MAVQLGCFIADRVLPALLVERLMNRFCSSSRRKHSETFDDDAFVLTAPAAPPSVLFATNFEEDKLWGLLRPLPGLLLWFCVVMSVILPGSAPWAVALITFCCMGQCIVTMLFSLAYVYNGFRRMERSMMHPVTIPPLPPRLVRTPAPGELPPSAQETPVVRGEGGAARELPRLELAGLGGGSSEGGVGGGSPDASGSSAAASSSSTAPAGSASALAPAAPPAAFPAGAPAAAGAAASANAVNARGIGGRTVGGVVEDVAAHPAEVLHLIAICRCTEPIDVLEDVLDNLSTHSNRGSYIIQLCLEARDPHAARVGDSLVSTWGPVFHRVMYAIHPAGVESEVPGKSANVNFGVRAAAAVLELELGARAVDLMVVTVADCDAKISEHYFNELSVRFAASVRERREVFFAPPSLFDLETAEQAAAVASAAAATTEEAARVGDRLRSVGKGGAEFGEKGPVAEACALLLRRTAAALAESAVGRTTGALVGALVGAVIPSPVKIADQMWSIFVLQNLSSVNWCRLPCSTYSVGMRLIAHVGYWDTGVESVPEDYHTALKLYWGTAGRARCEPIFHPVLYQHIDGGGWFSTVNQRFQQGIRHMWGATDFAYVLWLVVRMPVMPLLAQMRIVATVMDVHVSNCASAYLATFAMPLLAFLRPGYFGTPLGSLLLTVHINSIWTLIGITMVTGAVYEWYATEMVRACKRSEYQLQTGGAAPLAVGSLAVKDRSVWAVLPHCTPMAAANFFLKMLPWVWAPITAVMYLLGPSAVAQTKLIFSNRMRKAHVSPKSVPTPASTPRPGATPTPLRSERESVDHSPSAPLTPLMPSGGDSFRPIKLGSFSGGSGPNSRREE